MRYVDPNKPRRMFFDNSHHFHDQKTNGLETSGRRTKPRFRARTAFTHQEGEQKSVDKLDRALIPARVQRTDQTHK